MSFLVVQMWDPVQRLVLELRLRLEIALQSEPVLGLKLGL